MSKLSINQASKLFKVSRNTIYARIKKGDITKDSEGFVSAQDMVRLFGNKTDKKATEKAVIELLNSREQTVQGSEQEVAHLKSNNEQLLEQQIEQLKAQVEQLEKQLEYVKANEAWLKQQLDQKLIEHKNREKKGILSKLFG
jgi:molecular chaperone GrpE (heat shock protein)